jgi:2-dehydropantoate 2-reductase
MQPRSRKLTDWKGECPSNLLIFGKTPKLTEHIKNMTEPSLKILIFGAGAIGTYIGGSLAHAGHHAVFLERPEVAESLRQNRIRIEKPEPGVGTATITLPATAYECAGSLSEALSLGPFDVALYALKSFDTASAIASFSSASLPPVLCLSNGVDNEPALAEAIGGANIIAGAVTTAVGRRAAGDVIVERLRGLGVAGGHPLSARLASAMNEAGLNARLYPNAADMKWSKMLTNLLANASSAILNLPPVQIFTHPGLFRLEIEQLREALRVMKASGLHVVNLPQTPVKALAFAAQHLPLALSRPFLVKAVGSGRGGKMPSFHIDLYSGRGQSEVGYLNGAVVRHGEQVGVPTPVNRLLTDTLLGLTRGEIQLEAYALQPEKLMALWGHGK